MKKLIERYKAWRKRRYWAARHLEFLQNMLMNDVHWLSHHPIARELAERHQRAASTEWYKHSHESISNFRTRIGLDPNHKATSDK